LQHTTLPDAFLERASVLLDWRQLDPWIDAVETRIGKPISIGQYKMLLLERWFQLSSPELADECHARASFRRFLGAPLHGPVVDVELHREYGPKLAAADHEVGKLIAAAELLLSERGLTLPMCAWTGREPTLSGAGEDLERTRAIDTARRRGVGESTDIALDRSEGVATQDSRVERVPSTVHWPWGLVSTIDGPVRIGRDSDFSSLAQHLWADLHVSRRHAELEPCLQGVIVRDLGSSNGTFVNEHPLASPGEMRVSGNALLRFGPRLHAQLIVR